MRFGRGKALLLVALVAALAGTGVALALTAADPSSGTSRIDELDFNRPPLADGGGIGSLNEATAIAGFRPVHPLLLGEPSAIYVHAQSDPGKQTIALVFDSSAYGRFFAYQTPLDVGVTPQAVQGSLESLAVDCADASNECEGRWAIVMMADGTKGLLIEGSEHADGHTTTIMWTRTAILYNIVGPASTFSAADAIAVGNLFIAASPPPA